MPPQDAISQGLDKSICGDCPLSWAQAKKGEARCYVLPFQAPYRVFEQWEAGKYPHLDALKPKQRQLVMEILASVPIRLGAYGDPSCDQDTLQMLVEHKWTGYTHQWRKYPHLKQWLMASVDSVQDYYEAKQLGFRTYRHTRDKAMLDSEIQCPHDTHGVECVSCLLCSGNRDRSGKDIVTWTI